ncbi:MAG: sigma-70 family RNA polymerase sigma factor [Candidatus Gastranaerophilaceae bacterium]
MPLVKKVARTLARRSTDPVEDIIQVGSLGLIKAIRLYNPEISRNFKSYATYLITGEIRHYLRDKASMIKAPRAIQELAYRVHKMTLELIEEMGEKPTDHQIADKMELPVDKVKEAINADRRKTTLSLDQLSFQDDDDNFSNWSDKIADVNYENLQSLEKTA